MRVAVIVVLLSAAVVVAACGFQVGRDNAYAQRYDGPTSRVQDGQLIAFTSDSAEGVQQIVVIDPKTHVLSVYHIPRSTGQVTLKSVRNIHWDLQMDEFNGEAPSPKEIRSLLKPR